MSSGDSESDEEEFLLARYGTPMEELDDPEVPKKPIAVHEQIVTDEQGRRRFHGAFTGGFSAGYYNTVDTEEGWTPSSFRSSRSDRGKNQVFVPEDYMDSEDLSEFGIAPKKIVPQSPFSTANKENENDLRRKRKFKKNSTMLLGLDMLQSLVVPTSNSIGIKLLQMMGWKPGQGIGPKVKKPKKSNVFIPDDVEFAPEDCIPMEFTAKDNIFGLEYTGMDPKKALHDKVKKSSEIAIRTKSGAKLSFAGQAFGVGAYEEEDTDIYAQDTMANYDLEMTEEKADDSYGWSKPKKAIGASETHLAITEASKVLDNFKKAEKSGRRKLYAPPILPPDYDAFKRSKVMQKFGTLGPTNVSELTPEEEREKKFERLNPKERGEMLGEIQNWKSDEKQEFGENDSIFSLLKPGDRQRLQILKHGGVGQPLPPKQAKKSGFYGPFASNPAKQERYDKYLKLLRMKEADPYSKVETDPNMTEWEMQQEREEFTKSSRFFQPLSATMSSRFAPESEDFKKQDEKEESQKEAVKMKMFGMLTRESFEWHPDSLLCKRFNVPNPYPHSDIVGVPGHDSGSHTELFLHPDDINYKSKPKLQIQGQNEGQSVHPGSKSTGIVKDTKNPPLFNRNVSSSSSRWDEKPREQLVLPKPVNHDEDSLQNEISEVIKNTRLNAIPSGEIMLENKKDKNDVPPSGGNMETANNDTSSGEKQEEDEGSSEESEDEEGSKPTRPPMDIFRAIFANSDSSSDSESDGEEVVTLSTKKQGNVSKNLSNSHIDASAYKNFPFGPLLLKADQPSDVVSVITPGFHKFTLPQKENEKEQSAEPEIPQKMNTPDSATNKDDKVNIEDKTAEFESLDIPTRLTESVEPLSQSRMDKEAGNQISMDFEQKSVQENPSETKDPNVPLFHKFLPKKDRTTTKRTLSTDVGSITPDEMAPGETFGPSLPPIKVPKVWDTVDLTSKHKKAKKLKHKKKKHKKEKKKKK